MLRVKDFSIGGYNFDDYSSVKELYIPTDVSTNPARTLHVRGRESLEHHLQHYFIPYDKKFIALRASVRVGATNTIGLFGTHYRWRKGVNPAWDDSGFDYWVNIHHVLHTSDIGSPEGAIYKCIVRHNSAPANEPGVGVDWETYWVKGMDPYSYDWAAGVDYKFNQFVSNDDPVLSGYRCTADHLSVAGVAGNEPCVATAWADYWDIGDEMQADLSWPYPNDFYKKVALANGTVYQFSKDVPAIFPGHAPYDTTNHEGRALDAMTAGGTMKADGILWGIEIDA